MGELVTTHKGRPTVLRMKDPITKEDTVVYVSIKDDHYIMMKKLWRQKIAALHPDKGERKSSYEFRRAILRYMAWKNQQVREYRELGLTPPGVSGEIVPTTPYRLVYQIPEEV